MKFDMMLNFIEAQEIFGIAMAHVDVPTDHLATKALVSSPFPSHSTSKQTFQPLLCSFSIHFSIIPHRVLFEVQSPYFRS